MPRATATLSGGFSGRLQMTRDRLRMPKLFRAFNRVSASPTRILLTTTEHQTRESKTPSASREGWTSCCPVITAIMNRYFEHRGRAPNLADARLGALDHAVWSVR